MKKSRQSPPFCKGGQGGFYASRRTFRDGQLSVPQIVEHPFGAPCDGLALGQKAHIHGQRSVTKGRAYRGNGLQGFMNRGAGRSIAGPRHLSFDPQSIQTLLSNEGCAKIQDLLNWKDRLIEVRHAKRPSSAHGTK